MRKQPGGGASSLQDDGELLLPRFSDMVSREGDFYVVQVKVSVESFRKEMGVGARVA